MKKLLSFLAVIAGSLLFISNVSAQTLELPYGEYHVDGSSTDLGTAIVEMSDDLTLKTEGSEGIGVTLDYWYEADGGTVLDGYDYGLYLTAFVPTTQKIEAPFETTITLTLPSKFDQKDFKIFYDGEEVKATHNSDGSITFTAMVGTTHNGAFSTYFNEFDGVIFLKNAGQTGSTISADSSAAAETTIKTTSSLPAGSSLKVAAVEIPAALQTTETNLKKVFDISVLDTTGAVVEVQNNQMTITMGLDEELTGFNTYEVVYIKDGTVAERIPATVEDGKISFTTTHLSEYGIVAYNVTSEETPETFDNISWFIILGGVSLIGLLGTGLYLSKKKN